MSTTTSTTKKWIIGIIIAVILLTVGIPTLIAGGRFAANSVIAPVWRWGLGIEAATQTSAAAVDTPKTAASNATAPAAPAKAPASDDMALNEKTSLDPLDMPLWDDYYKAGVQVTESGDVWYAQSGKNGTNRLYGSITKDQILVLDCYTLVKDGTTWDNGNLLMLRGPVNFDNYEIYYTNGAPQIVDPDHAQELLDYNIAVKFARGDWNEDKDQFSYKPWALAHTWTLDYTYHSLVGKLNATNDNYPR